MEESRSKKTFWDYLRRVVITIIALFVAILVIIAIWGQPTSIDLAYVKGLFIGTAVGFILRSSLISKRKNK